MHTPKAYGTDTIPPGTKRIEGTFSHSNNTRHSAVRKAVGDTKGSMTSTRRNRGLINSKSVRIYEKRGYNFSSHFFSQVAVKDEGRPAYGKGSSGVSMTCRGEDSPASPMRVCTEPISITTAALCCEVTTSELVRDGVRLKRDEYDAGVRFVRDGVAGTAIAAAPYRNWMARIFVDREKSGCFSQALIGNFLFTLKIRKTGKSL